MYILSTGCQWRAIPKDLPPKSSVHDYFDLWTYDGTLERIHDALYQQCREQAQRKASPTVAIIDTALHGTKRPISAHNNMIWRQTRPIALVHCSISRFDIFGKTLRIEQRCRDTVLR
jgi:transposase